MHLDLAHLPDDAATLQTLVRDLAAHLDRQTAELTEARSQLAAHTVEIEKLQLFLAALRRQQFGRSSEKSHPDQLALRLEVIEEQLALKANCDPAPEPADDAAPKTRRKPLPEHLPREVLRHEPAGILAFCDEAKRERGGSGGKVSVVAGAGFEPATFRL